MSLIETCFYLWLYGIRFQDFILTTLLKKIFHTFPFFSPNKFQKSSLLYTCNRDSRVSKILLAPALAIKIIKSHPEIKPSLYVNRGGKTRKSRVTMSPWSRDVLKIKFYPAPKTLPYFNSFKFLPACTYPKYIGGAIRLLRYAHEFEYWTK